MNLVAGIRMGMYETSKSIGRPALDQTDFNTADLANQMAYNSSLLFRVRLV